MAKTNRFNFHKLLKPIRLVLVGILALVFVAIAGVHSPAIMPEAAYIHHIQGSDLFIGAGNSNSREAAQLKAELQGNRILYVPGRRRGWAHLGFVFDWPLDSAGLLVQAGPDDVASQWSFPCTATSGRFAINWKKGSNRGCEEGVRVTATGAKSQGRDPNGEDFFGSKGVLRTATGARSPGFTLGEKGVFTAQAGVEEVILLPPNSEAVTIQTRSSDTGIEVDTIFGDILVKSAKHPQGRLIREGQRYSYPQDTTTPIDRNAIVNSPEMQDFLNPNNWSSADLPQNVADGLAQQLGEMRTALESVPPSPVATQPTPYQPTATQPTPSQPTTTQSALSQSRAQPADSYWILELFAYNTDNGTCEERYNFTTPLFLTGSSLNGQVPYGGENGSVSGNITGNSIQLTVARPPNGAYSYTLNGSLNEQGSFVGTGTIINDVTGLCEGRSGSFTLRQASPE